MRDVNTRYFEMFQRVKLFHNEESGAYTSNTFIMELVGELFQIITDISVQADAQASGKAGARRFTQSKAAVRNNIIRILSAMSRTARAMSVDTPGIEQKFRFNQPIKDQDLLTTARTFLADALPIKGEFIKRGMKPDFLNDLESLIAVFEQTLSQRTEQTQTHVNATATIDDLVDRGIKIVRQMDVAMRNIFADDPGKLAAWLSASHVERSSPRTKPAPVPAPTA